MSLNEVNWDEFEFRCHYLGELMTQPKGKSKFELYSEATAAYWQQDAKVDEMKDGPMRDKAIAKLFDLNEKMEKLKLVKDVPHLSATCIRRLAQIYTEKTTGREKNVSNIYVEKGLAVEEDGITLYSMISGKFYKKNKERVHNGFLNGEIDFDDPEADMTIDVKCSWDAFTFDQTVIAGLDRGYEWQGQGYMWLKNRKKHRIAYCLVDTPLNLIRRMQYNLKNQFQGTEDEYKEACDKILRDNTYDDLPLQRKIRIYDINRDDEKIEMIKSSIPKFREYLKNFDKNKLEVYGNYEDSIPGINPESNNNTEERN